MGSDSTALITGYPALRARFVLEAVAAEQPDLSLVALVHPERSAEAEQLVAQLPAETAQRLRLCSADPAAIDFGLPGREYLELAERVEVIHAAYSITDPNAPKETCERVTLGAARELLELSRAVGRPSAVVLYSSVFVSGNRSGRVLESELEAGQSFRNPAERTLAIAERMLRHSDIPLAVLRAGHLLGDTRTGFVDKLTGPYPLVVLAASVAPDRPLPVPPGAEAPLPLTPVDYLARVGAFVSRSQAFGRTVHVLDPERLTLHRFLELCAARSGRRLEPKFSPSFLPRALLSNPAARLLPQSARAILEVLTTSAEYDTRALGELTRAGAPLCPSLESYLDPLLDHVRTRIQDGTLASGRHSLGPHSVA